MRSNRHVVVSAIILAAVGSFVASAGGDPPAPATPDDEVVETCQLAGADPQGAACGVFGSGCGDTADVCGAHDPSCSKSSSHLLNLVKFLSSKQRAAGTCDTTQQLASMNVGSAFACLDAELKGDNGTCLQASLLAAGFEHVLDSATADDIHRQIGAATRQAMVDHACSSATVLCLDRDGKQLGADKILQKGDQLTVVVLSWNVYDVGTASVSVAGVKALDTLAATAAGSGTHSAGQFVVKGVPIYVIASAQSEPIADTVKSVRITYRRDDAFSKKRIDAEPLDIAVEQGRYYVDFGLAVPFTILGKRVVDPMLGVSSTTAPHAAIAAIIFPAGRPKNEIRIHGTSSLGIQIGTDFDFTKSIDEKDYYFGGAWEPVAGFGIAAGVALIRGQYISSTGAPSLSYLGAPYVGVFLTPDFVSTARTAVTSLQAKGN